MEKQQFICELMTPNGILSFLATDVKTAVWVGLYIGQGNTGCFAYENYERKSIPTTIIKSKDPEQAVADYLGMPYNDYLVKHKKDIKESCKSFLVGDYEARVEIEKKMVSMEDDTDKEKLRMEHSIFNGQTHEFVMVAWNVAENL